MTLAVLIYLVLGGLFWLVTVILCSDNIFEGKFEEYKEGFSDKPVKQFLWAALTSVLLITLWFPVFIWVIVKVIKD